MSRFSKKNVLIYVPSHFASGEDGFGLGDIIRLLALTANFDAATIGWCSHSSLFALARLCEHVDDLFSEEELSRRLSKFDVVLNLGDAPVAPGLEEVILGDLTSGTGTLKFRTFDLPGLVATAIGIDATVSWPLAGIKKDKTPHDVGFNMRVPEAWHIKELPEEHWDAVQAALDPSVSISRQPPDGDLEAYISWINSCRVLVSVVGLGCHLAMALGKPLLILSGPTDFSEAGDYEKGRVLYPGTPCEFRPCHQPTGVDNCGCMGAFDPGAIAANIMAMLTSDKKPPR
jgi:hypothetical protein